MDSQAKKTSLALICALAIVGGLPAFATAQDFAGIRSISHSWGSKRLEKTLWGIARADVDGNAARETIVLESNAVWVGNSGAQDLVKGAAATWDGYIRALRLFAMDVDGDGREEIVISAVFEDVPASMIMKFDGDRFKPLIKDIRWHLRVIPLSGQPTLVGQRSTRDDFFSGKIYTLSVTDGKIIRGKSLDLPRWAEIFNFTYVPPSVEDPVLTSLNGYAPLKAYARHGKKWKKFWTSNGRYGGTMRVVELTSRPPLQDLPQYQIPVGHEPTALALSGIPAMIAVRHDIPLRNIVLQKELLKGGRLVAFASDESLGFKETFVTEHLPGFIADYCIDGGKLYVALQNDPEFMSPSQQSSVLVYDVPGYAASTADKPKISPLSPPAETAAEPGNKDDGETPKN